MDYAYQKRMIEQISKDSALLCTRPWTSLEERSLDGDYRVCCFINETLGQVSKANNAPILPLFHSNTIQKIREAFADNTSEKYCPDDCPVIVRKKEVDAAYTDFTCYDEAEFQQFPSAFRENRERVLESVIRRERDVDSFPLRFKLHPSNTCNLRCRMCMQNKAAKADIGDGYKQNLSALLPYLEELTVFGGEPFACRFTRGIIFGSELRKHPQIHFSTISNGTLLDGKTLELLKPLRLGTFSFSLDSCHKDVYERIRVGASYEGTFRNIDNLVRLRDQGKLRIREIEVNFTIQRVNYHEIADFVAYANSLNVHVGFGLVTGFDELTDNMSAVRDNIQAGIETADRLGDQKTKKELSYISGKLTLYEKKLHKLGIYYKLLSCVDQDRVILFMRNHPRLKRIIKKMIHLE